MKGLRHIFLVITSTGVLLVSNNAGRAAEQTEIPSFVRVLVVNNAEQPVVADVQSGFITATVEMQQEDGRWRALGKLRAPTGASASPALSKGEVWQFVLPELRAGPSETVRLAVGTSGQTIYSQPFRTNVDLLTADTALDCWLARIKPAHADQAPVIAAAGTKPVN